MSKWKKFNQFAQRAWSLLGRKSIFIVALLAVLVLVPFGARGQLGLDPCCAIISVGLNTISGLLKNVVAKPLSAIQQIQQQAANFEQQIVYPLSAINNARGLAGQMQGQLRQMTQLYRLPTNSATLPTPQQFEQALLSHSPQAISTDQPELLSSLRNRDGPDRRASAGARPGGHDGRRGPGGAQESG